MIEDENRIILIALAATLFMCLVPLILAGYWAYQVEMTKLEVCKVSQNVSECIKAIQ